MQQIREKYSFDEKQHLGGLYQDAQIKNSTYRAKRNMDDKEVQVVIYRSSKAGQIASYHKKISKCMEVRHFNLTPILECSLDSENNLLIIVLEWNQGYSLKEFLGEGVLHWRTAYFIVKDVLSGLAELHKEGLIYSFVNLENIEIFEGRGRLSFRYLIYKTYYLSPEVKDNHQKSKESDLFSIGVCLYRLIFGMLPFKSKSAAEYAKSVKTGVARRMAIQNAHFAKIIPTQLQQYINTLCHFLPAQRNKYEQLQKKVQKSMKLAKPIDKQLISSILGENYILLSVQECSEEHIRATVISTQKRKQKQQKRVFYLQMVRHNLTEISTYIDDIIVPFKNATNLYFANVQEFYVIHKDCLVIVYDYCSQASLQQYHELSSFSKEMVQQVSSVLKNLLSQWKGQYRFLTNQEILINNGRPVLKYPPFPTSQLKGKLKLSKKGNYFIAPQVEAGIQSLNADSWSVGVIQYWMRFSILPEFDTQGNLLIKDKGQLTPQKAQELTEIICRKHRQRKNLFPLQNKPVDRKISSDSYSSSQSPRMSSRIKSVPSVSNAIKMTSVGEFQAKEQDEQELQEFQLITPSIQGNSSQEQKTRQKVQSGDFGKPSKNDSARSKTKGPEEIVLNDIHQNKLKKRRDRRKAEEKNIQRFDENIFEDKQLVMSKKDSELNDINTSHLNLVQKKDEETRVKRFPTFSGAKDLKEGNRRDSLQKQKEEQKDRKDSVVKSQQSRRKTLQAALGVEDKDFSKKLLSGLAKQGWKLSVIERHWSKPMRVVMKGLLALLIYIFAFYYTFLAINGSLMKSRYDYSAQVIYLRSDSLATTATINFTSVTRTPLETYNSLNNQTLSYVRDTLKCVTNQYSARSNVSQVINSGSFGTYQAFGFIIAIFNLLLLCVSLAKLDLPKALSMVQFDDNFYAPLYNWFFVNLALSSLTSCTYLVYGGLFDLQLDPCMSRSSFPSLTYLLKSDSSSFLVRFIWIYIGIGVAYALILYLLIRPKVNLHKYIYVCLFLLYIAGVGVRALGTYTTAIYSVFGVCGELLSLLVGIPLFMIDSVVSCKLSKIDKQGKNPKERTEAELEATQSNFQ